MTLLMVQNCCAFSGEAGGFHGSVILLKVFPYVISESRPSVLPTMNLYPVGVLEKHTSCFKLTSKFHWLLHQGLKVLKLTLRLCCRRRFCSTDLVYAL